MISQQYRTLQVIPLPASFDVGNATGKEGGDFMYLASGGVGQAGCSYSRVLHHLLDGSTANEKYPGQC